MPWLGGIQFRNRIITAHVQTTVFQVYAPTEEANDIEKEFYDVQQTVNDGILRYDLNFGYMNAQFSRNCKGFEDIIGPFASFKCLSDNGERLLSFCTYNNLCIGNTFFQHK